jgi:growth arrest-specific protein 8
MPYILMLMASYCPAQVYMQKVKHLEYEHKHAIKSVTNEGRQLLHDEVRHNLASLTRMAHVHDCIAMFFQHEAHEEKERSLKTEKLSLKTEAKEKDLVDMDEVTQLRQQNEKNLQKMREGFEANLDDLRNRCADRLKQVRDCTWPLRCPCVIIWGAKFGVRCAYPRAG